MQTLQPIVEAIWRELDLPLPFDEIGSRYSFDLSDTPITLQLEQNGHAVMIRGALGTIPSDEYQAQDVLRRLMRFGLGLMAINHAALDIPNIDRLLQDKNDTLVQVFAVFRAQVNNPQSAVDGLQHIVEWKGYAETVLFDETTAENPRLFSSDYNDPLASDVIIIKP